MSSPRTATKNDLVSNVSSAWPHIRFVKSDECKWDPQSKCVHYREPDNDRDIWSFFHELGHGVLDHTTYKSDLELLKMEVLAWEKAKELAVEHSIKISQEHIEKCIDSYRDWLHRRSKCRRCEQTGIEKTTGIYSCLNCSFTWKVSSQRFCRVYRKEIADS